MTNAELAKKNYARGLWTDQMLDALATKGKITEAQKTTLKAEVVAEKLAKETPIKAK